MGRETQVDAMMKSAYEDGLLPHIATITYTNVRIASRLHWVRFAITTRSRLYLHVTFAAMPILVTACLLSRGGKRSQTGTPQKSRNALAITSDFGTHATPHPNTVEIDATFCKGHFQRTGAFRTRSYYRPSNHQPLNFVAISPSCIQG